MLACLLATAAMAAPPRMLMAHYMPWFESKAVHGSWGWHWTMGVTNPDVPRGRGQDVASNYHPLIGAYDSGDPYLAEYHVLLMKYAGFDGLLVDWYGNIDHFDYLSNHRHTQLISDYAAKAGLKFALVYEDATVNQLLIANKFKKEEAVLEGAKLMKALSDGWFKQPNYLRIDGNPLFLVFGPQYYQSADWTEMFKGIDPPPAFFTLHHRREPAMGAYDWPLPKEGLAGVTKERTAFYERAKDWPAFIPAAYPRFDDYYKQAGLHDSWGNVPAEDGKTYRDTLTEALKSKAQVMQVATWNDWGEGTQIEPSAEEGYRYLEMTQDLCRQYGKPIGDWTKSDLRLPFKLYQLRQASRGKEVIEQRIDAVADLLFAGKTKEAAKILDDVSH